MANQTFDQKEQKPQLSEKSPRKQNRSPSHPACDLREAIERARTFYNRESFNFANTDVAIGHWGYSPKSSAGQRTLAALIHYGLLQEAGSASNRQVRLTESAKTLLLAPEDTQDYASTLRRAALQPALYSRLWTKWGPNLPSDANMEFYLVKDLGFNPKSVKDFIRDFRSTVELANLHQSGILSEEGGDDPGEPAGELEHRLGGTSTNGSPKPEREKTMPETGRSGTQALDLPILLIEGGQATLRVPIPLSEEDFDHLTSMLDTILSGMKKAMVRRSDPTVAEE